MQPHNIFTYDDNPNKKITTTSITSNKKNKNITNNKSLAVPRSHHGSTTQACAACKYQRRKCASDCILAPYFPHDHQRQFLNAHRLFGVSNIVKIVRHLEPQAKDHAMRTIIFQSDARAADPVGGCYRIIQDLERQISLASAELEIVLHHLALCRAAARQEAAQAPLLTTPVVNSTVTGDPNEEWWEQYAADQDVNSRSYVDGINVHAHAESTSSSFPHDHRDHVRSLSIEEHDNDMMKTFLDQLCGEDGEIQVDFKFDSHGHILPSNNELLTQEINDTFKEDDDDECIPYVQDHDDIIN